MNKRLLLNIAMLLIGAIVGALVVPVLAQDSGPITPKTDDSDTPTEARNKALIYQMYDETNAGNGQFFFDLLADDYVDHNFDGGKEAFMALYDSFYTAFPDLHFEVTHVLADGDYVVARGVQTGTQTGNFMGMIPPTNKQVSWTGTAIFRCNEDGKIVERWQDLDQLGLFTQLGVIPPFGQTGG